MEPKVEAVYFKNIVRAPIGRVRAALRESLPSWALLGLSFVGGSVLEILTDKRLKPRLVATLKVMNVIEINDFDILGNGTKKETHGKSEKELALLNANAANGRLEKCIQTCRNEFANQWYQNESKRVNDRLSELLDGQPHGNETCQTEPDKDGFITVKGRRRSSKQRNSVHCHLTTPANAEQTNHSPPVGRLEDAQNDDLNHADDTDAGRVSEPSDKTTTPTDRLANHEQREA